MKTITLQRDHLGMKAGTECHIVYKYVTNGHVPMIRVSRADRRLIKTNIGKQIEASIPAAYFELEQEMAA